jgi:hypothetical protein
LWHCPLKLTINVHVVNMTRNSKIRNTLPPSRYDVDSLCTGGRHDGGVEGGGRGVLEEVRSRFTMLHTAEEGGGGLNKKLITLSTVLYRTKTSENYVQ